MEYSLTKEQIKDIVDTYGMDNKTVNDVINILNTLNLPFVDEEDFIDTVSSVISKLQTEKFERYTIKKDADVRAGHTIQSAIVSSLYERFNDSYFPEDADIGFKL